MTDVLCLRGMNQELKKRLKKEAEKVTGKKSINAFIHYLINTYLNESESNVEENSNDEKKRLSAKDLPFPISFSSKKRKQITFYENDVLNIESLCEKNKCSFSYYISSMVRNHLYNTIELTGIEVEALRNSNFQISGIGNNLNQIAKKLNSGIGLSINDINFIRDLGKIVKSHIALVADCLKFNLNRW